MIKTKLIILLCAITVANLDALQENAIVIQPTGMVVTSQAETDVADSVLGLALANNMAD